ncbi:MAG: corrinoid protein [Syntrophomonas sp.]|uniref:corrinoid protein n=1 Tax=Syntrophomonas sp. TaxID=2053627 RepID=UPI00261A5F00|nr:corrinoid protein [Syntrophomonas sp.]MDD2510390.1 corrinoid protein [Syntrophomonas sp.]MDD3879394.1 corrinoid protein [Syntrophomonas sp.]MDD4625560.1 corrinoid protein [Syntrophomonas sp.]
MDSQQEILDRLAEGVREMDEELAVQASYEALENKIDALTAINQGLVVGMNEAGFLYEQEEYFVPELLLCSDAMYAGLDVLSPHIQRNTAESKQKVVIGVVEGDTHDIGKNLVKLMLEVADFEIYDLGRDVPAVDFISKVKEVGADIVCLSTLMSTTMDRMADVIELLKKEGLREQVLVMIGGGPISQAFANRIGADAYSENAIGAVKDAKRLLSEKRVAI